MVSRGGKVAIALVLVISISLGLGIGLYFAISSSKNDGSDVPELPSRLPNEKGISIQVEISEEIVDDPDHDKRITALEWVNYILNESLAISYEGESYQCFVRFQTLPKNVIGSTTPSIVASNILGTTQVFTTAQLSHLTKGAAENDSYDWNVTFATGINWSYAVPGTKQAMNSNGVNFITVCVHEFCHGLGLYSQVFQSSNGQLQLGNNTPAVLDTRVSRYDDISMTIADAAKLGSSAIATVVQSERGVSKFSDAPTPQQFKKRPYMKHLHAHSVNTTLDGCQCGNHHRILSGKSKMKYSLTGAPPTGYVDVYTPATFSAGSSVAHLPASSLYVNSALVYRYEGPLQELKLSVYDLQLMKSFGWQSLSE